MGVARSLIAPNFFHVDETGFENILGVAVRGAAGFSTTG